jgi:hypothetical protein
MTRICTAIELLTNRDYPELSEVHEIMVSNQGIRQRCTRHEHKIQPLLGRDQTVDETLREALELQSHVLNRPAPEHQRCYLWSNLGEPNTSYQTKEQPTTCILALLEGRSLWR